MYRNWCSNCRSGASGRSRKRQGEDQSQRGEQGDNNTSLHGTLRIQCKETVTVSLHGDSPGKKVAVIGGRSRGGDGHAKLGKACPPPPRKQFLFCGYWSLRCKHSISTRDLNSEIPLLSSLPFYLSRCPYGRQARLACEDQVDCEKPLCAGIPPTQVDSNPRPKPFASKNAQNYREIAQPQPVRTCRR